MRFIVNKRAHRDKYSTEEARITSVAAAEIAWREMRSWPGYEPSPLISLAPVAQRLGVAKVLYKDESQRFGLGSFKALGGAYAAGREVQRQLLTRFGVSAAISDLRSASLASLASQLSLCCATDGNHGRSVAFAARQYGSQCTVFMHERALPAKVRAIEALGAHIVRTPGTYDDSVRIARARAAQEGWLLIADTGTDVSEIIPAEVIQGYGVMALELFEQMGEEIPTHVFLQGGVGGLAAGIVGPMSDQLGVRRPCNVVVEPEAAACLLESGVRGIASSVEGDLRTSMEMLSCGEASPIAWTILRGRIDAFVAIEDLAAESAAHELQMGRCNGVPIDVGVSGAAGMAGLVKVRADKAARALIGLGSDARVLLLGTEAMDRD
jgi:diaminopropionate ammonia-lyase